MACSSFQLFSQKLDLFIMIMIRNQILIEIPQTAIMSVSPLELTTKHSSQRNQKSQTSWKLHGQFQVWVLARKGPGLLVVIISDCLLLVFYYSPLLIENLCHCPEQ